MFKIFALRFTLLFAVSVLPSFSQAFPVPGNVQINPNHVVVQFCNTTCNYVLQCTASVTGIVQTGAPISAGGYLMLPPGQCGYAYVNAYYPYYFVNGQGFANCQ
jgi:hypothetical protein